jgi:hypothetical protein
MESEILPTENLQLNLNHHELLAHKWIRKLFRHSTTLIGESKKAELDSLVKPENDILGAK